MNNTYEKNFPEQAQSLSAQSLSAQSLSTQFMSSQSLSAQLMSAKTIGAPSPQTYAKFTIKDSVFTHLFRHKKYLLQMYQALHPEDASVTEDDLTIVTLENVLVNGMYNDLGFTVGSQLICLVEAQSTWTVNIIIRVILYYAKTLQEYLDEKEIDLYTSTKANIPKPEFYVVFTGERKEYPETIRFSDEFFQGEQTGLDITVKMLYGNAEDIIGEYVSFTKVYQMQSALYGRTEQAVKETVRICKAQNILKEYLESREKEVVDIMITLYDEEKIMNAHLKTISEQSNNQGYIRGVVKTIKLCKKDFSDAVSQIMDELGCDLETATTEAKRYW